MKQPSLFAHLRDIIILPFTVTMIVPYLILNDSQSLIPDHWIIKIFAVFFFIAGMILFLTTIILFNNIGKGTLAPWQPTRKLVIAGPYHYCRNPMISGVLFILIGEALWFHSTNVLIWSGLFFIINTTYFILIEEPSLLKRFGNDYLEYKAAVPRWIPKFKTSYSRK